MHHRSDTTLFFKTLPLEKCHSFVNSTSVFLFSAGIGNSGGDIAVELSRHTSCVFLSTRRGAWVLSRMGKGGEPFDQQANRRFASLIPFALRLYLFSKIVNDRFDHETFALRPQHPIGSQHPMVNDDLPHRIITGGVVIKPNVTSFTKTGVVFEDGTQVNDLDAVIFCTGYKIGFKFIDHSILPVSDNKVELYKYVFPPNLAKPTLAVFGCIQPLGAIFPISELQARWATRVFGGKTSLPPKSIMMEDIEKKRKAMQERYYATKRHTIQVRQQVLCMKSVLDKFYWGRTGRQKAGRIEDRGRERKGREGGVLRRRKSFIKR